MYRKKLNEKYLFINFFKTLFTMNTLLNVKTLSPMKCLLCLCAFVLLLGSTNHLEAQTATADVVDFFDDYAGKDGFTTVYISPKMFELISHFDASDPEAQQALEAVRNLKGIRILVYSPDDGEDEDGNSRPIAKSDWLYEPHQLYNNINGKIPDSYYEELMMVKSEDSDVRFMVKESNPGTIEELLMVVGTDSSFVFMSLVGTIDLQNISKIANSVDIDGFEHLEKLEEN